MNYVVSIITFSDDLFTGTQTRGEYSRAAYFKCDSYDHIEDPAADLHAAQLKFMHQWYYTTGAHEIRPWKRARIDKFRNIKQLRKSL